MSTTNPPPGSPAQGPSPEEWPADATRLDAPDLPATGGGVNPDAIRAGHEPDAFYVKPILSIPAAVVITFIVAALVALGVYTYFMAVPADPMANPQAVARNREPLDERLARIERAGLEKNVQREVDQPRLEPLRRLANEGQVTTQPPLPTGNSPEIHPEDIRPDLRPDKVPGLFQAGWVGAGKKAARIPITDAMKLATDKKAGANVLPVRKDPIRLPTSDQLPSGSNAGRGGKPGEAHDDHDHDHGKDAHKKGEPGKKDEAPMPKPASEPKKDEPKKDTSPAPQPPEKK
jgi:hypothetical protein